MLHMQQGQCYICSGRGVTYAPGPVLYMQLGCVACDVGVVLRVKRIYHVCETGVVFNTPAVSHMNQGQCYL